MGQPISLGNVRGPKGDTGATGAKGDTGATGAKGDTGATGAKGDTGATGAKGDTGATGAKGDTGATGAKGDTGATGAKGDKGDKGETGSAFIQRGTGTWATITTSPNPQIGYAYFLTSPVGAPNPTTGVAQTNDMAVYTAAGWINAGQLQGAKGDTGATGAKGDTGATGAKGDKGDTGATGAKGDKGDTGATGAKGDTGATGAKGDTGATGAKGIVAITTSDQSLAGTTLVGVSGMTAPVVAGKLYRFHASIIYSTTSTAVGLALSVSCPGGSFSAKYKIPVTATTHVDKGSLTSGEKIIATGTPAANTDQLALVDGLFNCTSGGNLLVNAASETAATVTISAGSILTVEEFS